MKLLTLNFLCTTSVALRPVPSLTLPPGCARKTCKSTPEAFPLKPRDAELEQVETDLSPLFIQNILPRLDWNAMKSLTQDVTSPSPPPFFTQLTRDAARSPPITG